jgi:kinesin family protein 1
VDILAHFEICELGASGEYVPVPVNHNEDQPMGGVFMLQQALQRRIRITLICENGSELHWKRVNELVVGE